MKDKELIITRHCERCMDTGWIKTKVCPDCHGAGVIEDVEHIAVEDEC
jgi:DnaJ-class molecular chaperone